MKYATYDKLFKINLLEGATLDGKYNFPMIYKTTAKPHYVISFDKCLSCKNNNAWVHFFIHDEKFQRLLNNPQRYLNRLSKFDGVFSPDCSLFWNYPLWKQIESIGNSRTIGSWLQRNGFNVIPTIRWGRSETWKFCFDAIETGGTVAVGTHGAMRNIESRKVFEDGFREMVSRIKPSKIIVYGALNEEIFDPTILKDITIIHFESEISLIMKERAHGSR